MRKKPALQGHIRACFGVSSLIGDALHSVQQRLLVPVGAELELSPGIITELNDGHLSKRKLGAFIMPVVLDLCYAEFGVSQAKPKNLFWPWNGKLQCTISHNALLFLCIRLTSVFEYEWLWQHSDLFIDSILFYRLFLIDWCGVFLVAHPRLAAVYTDEVGESWWISFGSGLLCLDWWYFYLMLSLWTGLNIRQCSLYSLPKNSLSYDALGKWTRATTLYRNRVMFALIL